MTATAALLSSAFAGRMTAMGRKQSYAWRRRCLGGEASRATLTKPTRGGALVAVALAAEKRRSSARAPNRRLAVREIRLTLTDLDDVAVGVTDIAPCFAVFLL